MKDTGVDLGTFLIDGRKLTTTEVQTLSDYFKISPDSLR
jgi:hypothetical protein